ncbi:MAG: ankyrin repeat domain-containing protein, partial [Spirochaetia bacterium]
MFAFADGNGISENSPSALSAAEIEIPKIFSDKQKFMTALEQRKLSLDHTDKEGNTLLHLAIIYRNREICSYLCKAGADINAQNKWGTTPLHLAVQFRADGVGRDLIDLGADLEIKNSKKQTPLILAVKYKNWGLFAALLRAGADVQNGWYSGSGLRHINQKMRFFY